MTFLIQSSTVTDFNTKLNDTDLTEIMSDTTLIKINLMSQLMF